MAEISGNAGAAIRHHVCFVVVYFGRWPEWIDYFLKSCAGNPDFHWRIFTDCDSDLDIPANVFIHTFNGRQLEELVTKKLGRTYRFSYAYKLNDFKPVYGHLFSEYLERYQFWGYTDLDLIYGNISLFVCQDILNNFDIITANTSTVLGHFTLLRNNTSLPILYQKCYGYLEKLFSETHLIFDENDFAEIVKKMARENRLRFYEKTIQFDDQMFWWCGRKRFLILWWKGNVVDILAWKPLCYFHFLQSKYTDRFLVESSKSKSTPFYIDEDGFHRLENGTNYWHFSRSLAKGMIATIPWYLKSSLKLVLPKNLRMHFRKVISRKSRS